MVTEVKKLEGKVSVDIEDTRYFFDTITDHSISIQNQITDNYIENNTTIQDHIARSPITVSVKGLIGEIVYTPPLKALNNINSWIYNKLGPENFSFASNKLTALTALLPPVDNITQAARDAVQYVEMSENRYEKIFKDWSSEGQRLERLRLVHNKLMDVRTANELLTVITPFATYDNMVIQSISLVQGNINYAGDVEITFKQVQFAETKTTNPDKNVMAKYTEVQRAEEVNNGKAQGKQNSIAYDLWKGNEPSFF